MSSHATSLGAPMPNCSNKASHITSNVLMAQSHPDTYNWHFARRSYAFAGLLGNFIVSSNGEFGARWAIDDVTVPSARRSLFRTGRVRTLANVNGSPLRLDSAMSKQHATADLPRETGGANHRFQDTRFRVRKEGPEQSVASATHLRQTGLTTRGDRFQRSGVAGFGACAQARTRWQEYPHWGRQSVSQHRASTPSCVSIRGLTEREVKMGRVTTERLVLRITVGESPKR